MTVENSESHEPPDTAWAWLALPDDTEVDGACRLVLDDCAVAVGVGVADVDALLSLADV